MKGAYLKSVFLLAWGAILVVGVMDAIKSVRPYLVGKRAEIPLVILFFALLGGIDVWGRQRDLSSARSWRRSLRCCSLFIASAIYARTKGWQRGFRGRSSGHF